MRFIDPDTIQPDFGEFRVDVEVHGLSQRYESKEHLEG